MLYSLVWLLFVLPSISAPSEIRYEDFFLDGVLRVDIHQVGTADQERICIHELIEEPFYSGPRDRLIDDRDLGSYRYDLCDGESNTPIFSKGFCTLFGEWRTTKEAHQGIYRVFEHTLIMPFPKKDVILTVSKRDKTNRFEECFRQKIVLDKRFIRTESPFSGLKTIKLQHKGNPEEKVDVVILGDGYTAKEMKNYTRDARKIADELMSQSPFKENQNLFNLWAVESPSPDSGVDEPRKGSYKATLMEIRFNTFDLTHYPLSMEVHTIHDVAACVPYDVIVILYNSPRFGGGGLYNLYAIVPGRVSGVIAHEFGHCFGGLADEYYNSPVTYIDFYPKGIEPWEPNITALLNPEQPKWNALIKRGTPVPTPSDPRYDDSVGCFEGAGYRAKGMYRPCRNCIMLSTRGGFCPVCASVLTDAIRHYAK